MPVNVSFDNWDDGIYEHNIAVINDESVSVNDFNDIAFKCCTSNTSCITIQNKYIRLEIRPFSFKVIINREPLLLLTNKVDEITDESLLKAFTEMPTIMDICNTEDYSNIINVSIGKEYIINDMDNIFNNIAIMVIESSPRNWYSLYIYNLDGNLHIIRGCDLATNRSVSLYQTLLSQQCVMSNLELPPSVQKLYEELTNKLYIKLHTKKWYNSDIDGQEILDELLKEFRKTPDGFEYTGNRGLAGMAKYVGDFADGLRKLGYEPSQARWFIKGFPMLMNTKTKSARQSLLKST